MKSSLGDGFVQTHHIKEMSFTKQFFTFIQNHIYTNVAAVAGARLGERLRWRSGNRLPWFIAVPMAASAAIRYISDKRIT